MAFEPSRLGLAGQITRRFQDNPLTPILSMLGLLMGLVAVLITPQEEEPQIDVTMVNVMVPFPGAEARQVQQLVTWPLEQKLAEMAEVKHTHAVSRPGLAVLTVEFEVGVERQPALVRLYDKVFSNQDWLPPDAGVGPPLVKPRSIDDVPVMALTLWTDDPERSALELAEVAHSLETELKRLPGTRDLYTIGAPDRALLVELDAARLAAHGLTVEELAQALRGANVARHADLGDGADPVDRRPRAQRPGAGRGGPQPGNRAQAAARHAGPVHHRRPRPRPAGGAGCGPPGRPRAHCRRAGPGPAGSQRGAPRRRAGGPGGSGAGHGRPLPGGAGRSGRVGAGVGGGPAGAAEGRGHGARCGGPAHQSGPARRPPGTPRSGRRHGPGGDPGHCQEAGQQCRRPHPGGAAASGQPRGPADPVGGAGRSDPGLRPDRQ